MGAKTHTLSKHDMVLKLKSSPIFSEMNDEQMKMLSEHLSQISIGEGDVLFGQDDPSDAMYVLISGRLQAFSIPDSQHREVYMGEISPGEPVGEIQMLTSGTRTATVRAMMQTTLIKIPKEAFSRIAQHSPPTIDRLNAIFRQRFHQNNFAIFMGNLFGPMDNASLHAIEKQAKWCPLSRGEYLFHQGDLSDSLYIMIRGRLEVVIDGSVVGEIARGECVGEIGVFTGECRTASLFAIRDSELVRFSKQAVMALIQQYPQAMIKITQMISRRLRKVLYSPPATVPVINIAVIPATPSTPLSDFVPRLFRQMSAHGKSLYLSPENLEQLSGLKVLTGEESTDTRFISWLEEQETRYRFVIYQSDEFNSAWTRRCLKNADLVLIMAESKDNPRLGPIEKLLLHEKDKITSVRKILILVHPEGTRRPTGTSLWLRHRQLDSHHHIRLSNDEDVARIARLITGRGIGLVLGGGGARGLAHIGVIQAFIEKEIPIDTIGGTSMGSIVASSYAMGYSLEDLRGVIKKSFLEIKPLKEYTLPIIAILRSKRLDKVNKMAYKDTSIEDLWLNFFCVSSNLTQARMVVHRKGPVWKAVRASSSIPGLAVPAIDGTNLLVDGGFMNNVPGDVMRRLYGGTVITVDVSPERDLSIQETGFPSPWDVLWRWLIPGKTQLAIPNILTILTRSSMLYSIYKANKIETDADIALKPPVKNFGILEFDAMDNIIEAGYQYTIKQLDKGIDSIVSPT